MKLNFFITILSLVVITVTFAARAEQTNGLMIRFHKQSRTVNAEQGQQIYGPIATGDHIDKISPRPGCYPVLAVRDESHPFYTPAFSKPILGIFYSRFAISASEEDAPLDHVITYSTDRVSLSNFRVLVGMIKEAGRNNTQICVDNF